MQLTLFKLKKILIWGGSLVSLAAMAFGVFLYSQKLSKKDSTAPMPSKAAQNACYLQFSVETPPPPPPPEILDCTSLTAVPINGEYPLDVTFIAQASNPDLVQNYRFNFGDGTITTTTSSIITHTFENAGNYLTGVQMQDAQGNWTSVAAVCQQQVTVTTPPPPPPPPEELTCVSLSASPTTGNYPLTVGFTALGSNPSLVSAYRFLFGDGQQLDTTSSTTSHTYQQAGSYNARVRIRDLSGVWTPISAVCSKAISVTTPPPPPESFDCESLTANVTSGNTPLTVAFTARATIPSRASSYRFDFGDSSGVSTTANSTVSHTYATGGSFTAFVTILDSQDGWTEQLARCTLNITTENPPITTNLMCNDICSLENDSCPIDFQCIGLGTANQCRNPSCSGEADCTCDTTTTETVVTEITPQTPVQPVIPETGRIANTLKVIAAGLLLILAGIVL